MPYRSTKVVIIGGGFGGLQAAKALDKRLVGEIVVIDRTNHHLFQPLLYQVASAALSPTDIAVPIREVFRNHPKTYVIMGEVVTIDKKKRTIHMRNGNQIPYDYLIVAVGARHSYFGNDDWEEIAPGLKTLDDALFLREKILMSFEKAERSDSHAEAEEYLSFVVIGGGPTGVEMAGAIAEIAYKTMQRDYKRINLSKTKVYLVEAAPALLHTFPPKLSARVKKDLEKLGVQVVLGKMVTKVTSAGVEIGDALIPARNVIWAAGNQASPLLQTLDTPLDRQGRAVVEADLSLPGHPELFVIGDAACVKAGKKGFPLPATAPVAMQQGRYVANIICKQIAKEKRPAFKYRDKGSMAMIGKGKAVAWMGPLRCTGWLAWLAWGLVHILFLIGFRNRLGVLMEWFFESLTGGRRSRVINRPLDEHEGTNKKRLVHPHEEASCG